MSTAGEIERGKVVSGQNGRSNGRGRDRQEREGNPRQREDVAHRRSVDCKSRHRKPGIAVICTNPEPGSPGSRTRDLMRTLDAVRVQIGLRYPGEGPVG